GELLVESGEVCRRERDGHEPGEAAVRVLAAASDDEKHLVADAATLRIADDELARPRLRCSEVRPRGDRQGARCGIRGAVREQVTVGGPDGYRLHLAHGGGHLAETIVQLLLAACQRFIAV